MTQYWWVDRNGPRLCDSSDTSYESIGPKARGLLAIPNAWTLPFVLLSPQLFDDFHSTPPKDRDDLLDTWSRHLRSAIAQHDFEADPALIIRSNAADESLRDRGSLTSRPSTIDSLPDDLEKLLTELEQRGHGKAIGLIVQQYSQPIVRGHLSNERRLREEARDGVIQFEEVATGEISETSIAYRRWRNEAPPSELALLCSKSTDIRTLLREPLALAALRKKRMHFEWIWNGATVYIVQADIDEDRHTGKRPESLVGSPTRELDLQELSVFRTATTADRGKSSKLDNHFRFQESGFWQPAFYILEDTDVLKSISAGHVPPALEQDLQLLTGSLFVIRTSSVSRDVHLLPRSHLLASAEAASEWLTTTFIEELSKRALESHEVLLIGHHYVQAVASAFSMGEAHRQDVQIEASWGIPEGLYYYPCDTYVVNTLTQDARDLSDDYSRFTLRTVSKGPKRYFVTPDPTSGQFARHEVAPPYDWKPTIGDQDTLNAMAAYTRQFAAERGYPINLMWFVDCRTDDGPQRAIPWYGEPLDAPRVEPYRQNAKDTVEEISTEQDLARLEEGQLVAANPAGNLVIELNPTENIGLRDTTFAQRVGSAAAANDAIILLNGATLSHIYYVLQRSGAVVCSRTSKNLESESEFHQKLVRDKIPDVVRSSGEHVRIGTLNKRERQAALRIKLIEEAFEVKDATDSGLLGELADVLEVLRALARSSDLSIEQIEEERQKKEKKRGGFDDGIVLMETRTGPTAPADDAQSSLVPTSDDSPATMNRIESTDHGWRDARHGTDYWELIETATVPLSQREWALQSNDRSIPIGEGGSTVLTWEILGKREGARLRLKLRIQLGKRQLTLDLP